MELSTRNVPYVHLSLDSILESCLTFLIALQCDQRRSTGSKGSNIIQAEKTRLWSDCVDAQTD